MSKYQSEIRRGRKHTKEAIKRMSLAKMGHGFSSEARKKISDGVRLSIRKNGGLFGNSTPYGGGPRFIKGHHVSEKVKDKIRNARAIQIIPVKDTSIERMVQIALKTINVEFEKHVHIETNDKETNRHQFDIVVRKYNLVIEIDGCYFHGCSACINEPEMWQVTRREKDARQTRFALQAGWRVVRLAEHDLRKMSQENLVTLLQDFLFTEVRKNIVTSVGG
jgi:G:T-mismatch repair DNA endonuclease (very short patch repair protein)